MKTKRHAKILEIIRDKAVDTQEELIELLREEGFNVTQATVSRDIRELKIAKMTTGRGTYRYVLPKQPETGKGLRFSAALADSIVSVENACNLVVIKTYPGMANAVAVGIDGMNLQQVLGSVAGDDTILVATRDEEGARMLSDRLHDLLRSI